MQVILKNKTLQLDSPQVMGILNLTEDSFFAGSRVHEKTALLERAGQMIQEGAAILDLGACSTRPGAEPVSEETELKRLIPAIESTRKAHPSIILSADTFRSQVARRALEAGADIINDISAGSMDPELIPTIAGLKAPYILMHMKGTPADMQKDPSYNDVLQEVEDFFISKIAELQNSGIGQVILDPGFGFGKTLEHNYALLRHLDRFTRLGKPVLAGISRKSMIQKVTGTDAKGALNGSTAAHMIALQNGASILRVHDVKEAAEAVKIFNFTRQQK